MRTNPTEVFVTVYSSPVEFNAELVKSMLADEEIPSNIDNTNSVFPGVPAVSCHVLVPVQHESRARELVAEHEARHQARLKSDSQNRG